MNSAFTPRSGAFLAFEVKIKDFSDLKVKFNWKSGFRGEILIFLKTFKKHWNRSTAFLVGRGRAALLGASESSSTFRRFLVGCCLSFSNTNFLRTENINDFQSITFVYLGNRRLMIQNNANWEEEKHTSSLTVNHHFLNSSIYFCFGTQTRRSGFYFQNMWEPLFF